MLYSTRCWQILFLTAYKSPEFVINPRDLPPAKTTGTQLSQLEPGKGGKGGAFFNSKKGTWAKKNGMSRSTSKKTGSSNDGKNDGKGEILCFCHMAFVWFLLMFVEIGWIWYSEKLCQKILPNQRSWSQVPRLPKFQKRQWKLRIDRWIVFGGVMKSRCWFEHVLFSPSTWGSDQTSWLIFFDLGWFNHQPEKLWAFLRF